MRTNTALEKIRGGTAAINGWLGLPDTIAAEAMANAGFDSLTIDMQHGMIDFDAALRMLTAISTTPTTPIVRVPWLDEGAVMKMLDAGAWGVICPMVNTAEQAKRFVAATRYAPLGNRSVGPLRAAMYAGAGYMDQANDQVLSLAMIETREAMDNLDAICSVEGLGGVYIGPADLSASLTGRVVRDTMDGEVGEAIRRVLERAKAHGIIAASHASSTGFARQMREMGFQLVTCANDFQILSSGAAQAVREMRAAG
ncbi:MAG: aldolase/citrate lyase family protein [Pseudomonadota bacterium]